MSTPSTGDESQPGSSQSSKSSGDVTEEHELTPSVGDQSQPGRSQSSKSSGDVPQEHESTPDTQCPVPTAPSLNEQEIDVS